MPETGWFSHAFRQGPDGAGIVSIPASDVFYSLNVLLGLSRLPPQSYADDFDAANIFERCCKALRRYEVPKYAFGMALWAGFETGFDVPGPTLDALRALLDDEAGWRNFAAQDAGLLISGLAHRSRVEPEPWGGYARRLARFVTDEYADTPSGLFLNNPNRLRGRFATFATGAYLTLSHFHFGEIFGDERSIERASRCVAALGRAQGPRGEWPWYYDAVTGRVLDPYPVYSVHQDGMAPAYLRLAALHGHQDADAQIERGFRWILGQNEIGSPMLDADRGLVWRSLRRRERFSRHMRAARAVVNCSLRRGGRYVGAARIEMLTECRSYHLGWMLWSFGGQEDFPSLTAADQFSAANSDAGAARGR